MVGCCVYIIQSPRLAFIDRELVHAYGVSVNHSSVYFARLNNDNITSSKSWFNKIVSKFSLLGKVRFTLVSYADLL